MKWPMKQLGDVIKFRGGGTPRKDSPEYWSDEIPWATVKDFKGLYLSETQDSISADGLKSSSANLIPAGNVIIPTRMALGKAAINNIDLAINQDLRALIPQVPLDPKYLLHSMLGLAGEIERQGAGATVKGITQDKLSALKIPFPPLEEQKRIAAILDAADALRTKRRESLAQLDTLLQSTFLDMFGDCSGFVSIGELLANGSLKLHKDGNHGSLYPRADEFGEQGVPFLSAKCISEDGDLIPAEIQYLTEEKAHKLKIGWIEKGDVLLAHNASVGKTWLYKGEYKEALIGTSLTAFRPNPQTLNSGYLLGALRSQAFRQQLFSNMGQTTRNQVPITAQRRLTIPIPPLDLQYRFSAIAESVEQQKARLSGHLTELDTLFASLQHRAFNGDL